MFMTVQDGIISALHEEEVTSSVLVSVVYQPFVTIGTPVDSNGNFVLDAEEVRKKALANIANRKWNERNNSILYKGNRYGLSDEVRALFNANKNKAWVYKSPNGFISLNEEDAMILSNTIDGVIQSLVDTEFLITQELNKLTTVIDLVGAYFYYDTQTQWSVADTWDTDFVNFYKMYEDEHYTGPTREETGDLLPTEEELQEIMDAAIADNSYTPSVGA